MVTKFEYMWKKRSQSGPDYLMNNTEMWCKLVWCPTKIKIRDDFAIIFPVKVISSKKCPGTGRSWSHPFCIEPRPLLLVLEQLQLTWFTLQPTWNSMLQGWGSGRTAVTATDLELASRTSLLTWSPTSGAWVAAPVVSGPRWPLTRWACRSFLSGCLSPSFSTTYSSTRVP